MLRTPITLEVLLHCYYSRSPHPKRNVEVYRDVFEYLTDHEMITYQDGASVTTPKGEFFVEHILAMPFPKITFVIPGTLPSRDKVS